MHVWAPPPPCSVGDYQMHVALNKDKQKRDSKARVLASAMKMKEIHFLTIKSWRFTLRRNTLVKQWSTFGGQIRNPNTSFLNILLNVYRVCRQLRLHKLARGAGKGGLAPSTAPCTDGWAVPVARLSFLSCSAPKSANAPVTHLTVALLSCSSHNGQKILLRLTTRTENLARSCL